MLLRSFVALWAQQFHLVFSSDQSRLGSSRDLGELINPDIAIGSKFHVSATQWDGTTRCYFVDVGSRIEQGPTNLHSNKACEKAYRKEIRLGRYETTIKEDNRFMHVYSMGDSLHCGTAAARGDRRGLVPVGSEAVGRSIQRKTRLIMVKTESQKRITAYVREPRRCEYEVMLYGPEILLLGGAPGEKPMLTGGPAVSPAMKSKTGKPRKETKLSKSGKKIQKSEQKPKRAKGSKSKSDKSKPEDPSESKPEGKKGSPKPPKPLSKGRADAVKVMAESSRETLLEKPVRELNKLIRSLGGDCKACSEKNHLVDRLEELRRSEL